MFTAFYFASVSTANIVMGRHHAEHAKPTMGMGNIYSGSAYMPKHNCFSESSFLGKNSTTHYSELLFQHLPMCKPTVKDSRADSEFALQEHHGYKQINKVCL
jgi:methyltransferase-like protein